MHQVSGKAGLGFSLALVTTLLWGVLPIALQALLADMDAATISFVRFASAGACLWLWLFFNKRLPTRQLIKGQVMPLLALAVVGLAANYAFCLLALEYISAASFQVLIQLAPVLLIVAGVAFFRESFSPRQGVGLAVVITGLALFFNQRWLALFGELSHDGLGLLYTLAAALTWAGYGVAQKQLLKTFKSSQVMMVIYLAAALLFAPFISMPEISETQITFWYILLFCCGNTLVAYGCFAEALNHWAASKVSAVLAMVPVVTVLFAYCGQWLWPDMPQIEFNVFTVFGILLVVTGILTLTLAKSKT